MDAAAQPVHPVYDNPTTGPAPNSRSIPMKNPLVLFFALAATPVLAHDGTGSVHSLAGGLVHPLTGVDHLLAMLAVGVIASGFRGRGRLAVPGTVLAAMISGYAFARAGLTLPGAEAVILASLVVLGALCVLPTRRITASLIAAAFAVFHGYAHGMEAGTGQAFAFGLGFVTASAALIGLGLALGLAGRLKMHSRDTSRIEPGIPA